MGVSVCSYIPIFISNLMTYLFFKFCILRGLTFIRRTSNYLLHMYLVPCTYIIYGTLVIFLPGSYYISFTIYDYIFIDVI